LLSSSTSLLFSKSTLLLFQMVCSSSPLFLAISLGLLCLPQSSSAPLPTHEPPQLGLALLHLRALLDQPLALDLQTDQSPDPGSDQEPDQDQDLDQEEELDSDQDSQQDSDSELSQDLSQVLVQDSVLSRSIRGGIQRDLEDGGRLTETLTAVAGGLQAVSREKGGFGFRFGRKRWTPRIPTRTGLNQD
uniref:Uncharacterized protein n=1 Tax=Periophthalmus magnuspinnatus TaxID=409849 RepID=A0A3B3ZCR9_9GOBI